MTDKQLLEQALEAFEDAIDHLPKPNSTECGYVITAIRARLEQPEQEPVWCNHCNGSGRMVRDPDIGTDQECFVCDGTGVSDDTTPPAAQPVPVQEPVGEVLNERGEVDYISYVPPVGTPLYTTPPAAQRQWVGLTDEEVIKCTPTWGGTVEDVARAIEAKLKEKNTP